MQRKAQAPQFAAVTGRYDAQQQGVDDGSDDGVAGSDDGGDQTWYLEPYLCFFLTTADGSDEVSHSNARSKARSNARSDAALGRSAQYPQRNGATHAQTHARTHARTHTQHRKSPSPPHRSYSVGGLKLTAPTTTSLRLSTSMVTAHQSSQGGITAPSPNHHRVT